MSELNVVDPATEDVIATLPTASLADTREAIDRVAAAFPAWSATPPRVRSGVLSCAAKLMLERSGALAETIVRENGKPLAEAVGEVAYAAGFLEWYAEEAVRVEGSVVTAPGGDGQIITMRQPVGVALLITPWNFPAAMLTRKLGPALAAGCTAVVKPAEATPLTARLVIEILRDAGVSDDAVQLIVTDDAAGTVDAALAHPAIRKLSFTGSTAVGRVLLRSAAARVVNCSMELGGNAAFVVYADADLDAAVEGAMVAKLRHNGEACTAANRFYVEEPVVAEFAVRLASAMKGVRLGHGLDPSTTLGPLIDGRSRDRMEWLVQTAIDEGADVVSGGRRPPDLARGFFFEPTVLTDVEHSAAIGTEEIFGPLAPIISFEPGEDVAAMANDTEYGLVSYVFTRDLGCALEFGERSETGMVGVNTGLISDPAALFGGVKQSGLGREGGHEGLLAYCEPKYLAVRW